MCDHIQRTREEGCLIVGSNFVLGKYRSPMTRVFLKQSMQRSPTHHQKEPCSPVITSTEEPHFVEKSV